MIIQLLENHNSLSLRQIQEETNIAEDIIFKIISDMNLFKITSTGWLPYDDGYDQPANY